jgi:hypothetical protein
MDRFERWPGPANMTGMSEVSDPLLEGRNETPLQRCDRNLVELLQEVRVIQTGVQVLFAFLLMAPLSARFPQLTGAQRVEYFVTLLASGAAAVLLMAPTAHHRILFRCGDKDHLVKVANRLEGRHPDAGASRDLGHRHLGVGAVERGTGGGEDLVAVALGVGASRG